jgi:NRPS condensation-like uncharacterized protein
MIFKDEKENKINCSKSKKIILKKFSSIESCFFQEALKKKSFLPFQFWILLEILRLIIKQNFERSSKSIVEMASQENEQSFAELGNVNSNQVEIKGS